MSTTTSAFRPLPLEFDRLPEAEMRKRSGEFLELMLRRRSVRQFSDEPVPRELLEDALTSTTSCASRSASRPASSSPRSTRPASRP